MTSAHDASCSRLAPADALLACKLTKVTSLCRHMLFRVCHVKRQRRSGSVCRCRALALPSPQFTDRLSSFQRRPLCPCTAAGVRGVRGANARCLATPASERGPAPATVLRHATPAAPATGPRGNMRNATSARAQVSKETVLSKIRR